MSINKLGRGINKKTSNHLKIKYKYISLQGFQIIIN